MKEWENYQETVKEVLNIAKELGADQSEVGLISSMGLNVCVRMNEVDTLEFNRDKTMGITVYSKQRKGSASTTDFDPQALRATVEMAMHLAQLTESDPYSGLADREEMATH